MFKRLLSTFFDELHQLHRALFSRKGEQGARAVQFTAAHPGEGVTSTTLALAAVISSTYGHDSVIVVEGNLREPAFQEVLGARGQRTLVDVLEGRVPVEEAIQHSGEYGFAMIAGGQPAARGGQTTYEATLDNIGPVLDELKKYYRHVLVDSPAVIPYADATVIAGAVDDIVLVVESEVTRMEVVNRAVEKLRVTGKGVTGVILNKRQFHIPKWLYRLV